MKIKISSTDLTHIFREELLAVGGSSGVSLAIIPDPEAG